MCQIVAYVAEYASAEHGDCCVPIVEEDCMCKFIKRCCENEEEGWRHDEAVFVHWKIVMDAV